MYAKPTALPAEDVLQAAAAGAIVVWLCWGFAAGCKPKDDDRFYGYPQPVCDELTKALVTKLDKVTSHCDLPASDRFPSGNRTRQYGFKMCHEGNKFTQFSLEKARLQRQCFPCPVRWQRRTPDSRWELFPQDTAWALEDAYTQRHTAHEYTDPEGVARIVRLVGLSMTETIANRPFEWRSVRREGPQLFPTQLHFVQRPSGPKVSCKRKWTDDVDGGLPPVRVDVDGTMLGRFQQLMDRATQWHAFPSRLHRNLGCVPGPGRVRTQRLQVVKVERVQCPALWQAYVARRAELQAKDCGPMFPQPVPDPRLQTAVHFDAAACYAALGDPYGQLDSTVNEALLFHGTHRDVIEKVTRGAGRGEAAEALLTTSERAASTTAALGSGIYFADLASKSNLYVPCPSCGFGSYQRPRECLCSTPQQYQMVLCRVLLGRVLQESAIQKRSATYRDPEELQRLLRGFDSVFVPANEELGSTNSFMFREWAVYASNHVYPEFIITYTRHSA